LSALSLVPPLGGLENFSGTTCWLVSAKNDEKVLIYAIASRRSPSESRPFHPGIALPGSPSSIAPLEIRVGGQLAARRRAGSCRARR